MGIGTGTRLNILIAEDEPVSRLRLQSTLQRWGYSVTTAVDGSEALHEMEKPDRPAIAILDRMMPNVDGLEVCRAILGRRSLTGTSMSSS